MKHYEKNNDTFSLLSEEDKDVVLSIKSNFYYRNCKPHEDGSRGEIKITPKQFNNCLAYCILLNKTNKEKE